MTAAVPNRRGRAGDEAEIIGLLEVALRARDIIPPKHLIADGKLHRCDAAGRNGKDDASYLLHLDGIAAGGFQNWRDGIGWEDWRAGHAWEMKNLTAAERDEICQKRATDRAEREADEARRSADAARKAAEIWFGAETCEAHPYLTKKEVQALGIRLSRGDLVLPLRDAAGVLHSLQFIKPDGGKKYLAGGRVSGCYHAIGKPGDIILVGEGYATCATVHEVTEHAVAVAFDCGNLRPVAEALRAKYPEAKIVILADDDHLTVGNPGINKAKEAAAAVNGVVAVPDFGADRPAKAKDFNDLMLLAAADAVRACIKAALDEETALQKSETARGAAMPRDAAARERARDKGADDVHPAVREFPVLADEALVGLPGEIVRTVAPHTESDATGLLLSLHAMFGNCIGRGPHYRVEATEHGPNLYVVKVGDSSKARKGTGEDRILAFFRHADDDWANHRVHTGLSSGEGVIWEVRDEITKKMRDKKSGAVVEEVVDYGITDKRLMVIESEFAGALRVMQREGNILSRILRDGWDRGSIATLTKNAQARATGACISIVGHITAPELRTYFDRTEMANGFGNRFLFACVRRSSSCRSAAPCGTRTFSDWHIAFGARSARPGALARSRCRPRPPTHGLPSTPSYQRTGPVF
jgi:phage/plasmid primase-like uncharacterized protein